MDGDLRGRTADRTSWTGSSSGSSNLQGHAAGSGLVFIRLTSQLPHQGCVVPSFIKSEDGQGRWSEVCKRELGRGGGKLLLSLLAKYYSSFIPVNMNKEKKKEREKLLDPSSVCRLCCIGTV